MLFAEVDKGQVKVINDCLEHFRLASGQKVSLPKSRVYFSKNISLEHQADICGALNIEATNDLGLYLGMPTLTSRVTKEIFRHICEKIDRRLSGWKSKYLSLAGRITLAKSKVSTVAYYSMQTAKIPRSICDDIDKKNKAFHLGESDDRRAVHLLSWETLQKPTEHGGIAMTSARQASAAFLTKLWWRILSKPDALWSRVLRSKYCKGRCDIDMFEPK